MTLDPPVLPGLFFLAAELLVLTAFGYVAARVALRQTDGRLALAQGLVIGPALWGLIVNFVLYLLPGLAGAVAVWVVMLACGAVLAWRAPSALRLPLRTVVGFCPRRPRRLLGSARRSSNPVDSRRGYASRAGCFYSSWLVSTNVSLDSR